MDIFKCLPYSVWNYTTHLLPTLQYILCNAKSQRISFCNFSARWDLKSSSHKDFTYNTFLFCHMSLLNREYLNVNFFFSLQYCHFLIVGRLPGCSDPFLSILKLHGVSPLPVRNPLPMTISCSYCLKISFHGCKNEVYLREVKRYEENHRQLKCLYVSSTTIKKCLGCIPAR